MNNSFLNNFIPKEPKFFPILKEMADVLLVASDLIIECVQHNDHESAIEYYRRIKEQEKKGDVLNNRVFDELNTTFITPFDREDIHYLASALDDICDYIYATTKKINFYKVNPNDSGIQKMADLIEQGAAQIQIAVKELRNMRDMRKITDALVKVNSIENQADDIFDLSIERLFETEPDAKEVIKKREIYQVMEIVTDKCEDAANVIESIIIKYA